MYLLLEESMMAASLSPYEKIVAHFKLSAEEQSLGYLKRRWKLSPRAVLDFMPNGSASERVEALERVYTYFARQADSLKADIHKEIQWFKKPPRDLTVREEERLKWAEELFKRFQRKEQLEPSLSSWAHMAEHNKLYGLPPSQMNNVYLPLLTILKTEKAFIQADVKKVLEPEHHPLVTRARHWKLLGQGSFGSVYRAFWRGSTPAAIKLEEEDGEGATSFKQEARLLRKVSSHRNIIRYLAEGTCISDKQTSQPCIVTRLAWKDLFDFQLRYDDLDCKNWEFATNLSLLIQMAAAMTHCHKKQVVHNDFKPENCVVTRTGTVKLLDFGLAYDGEVNKKRRNSLGLSGTPEYMPPEVVAGNKRQASGDVYALGIGIWELSAGQKAFSQFDPEKVPDMVFDYDSRPALPHAHPLLRDLASDCWQRDPKKRPTAREALNRLYDLAEKAFDNDWSAYPGGGYSQQPLLPWGSQSSTDEDELYEPLLKKSSSYPC